MMYGMDVPLHDLKDVISIDIVMWKASMKFKKVNTLSWISSAASDPLGQTVEDWKIQKSVDSNWNVKLLSEAD